MDSCIIWAAALLAGQIAFALMLQSLDRAEHPLAACLPRRRGWMLAACLPRRRGWMLAAWVYGMSGLLLWAVGWVLLAVGPGSGS